MVCEVGYELPEQDLIAVVDQMIGDALRVEPIEFDGTDHAVDRGVALSNLLTDKQVMARQYFGSISRN